MHVPRPREASSGRSINTRPKRNRKKGKAGCGFPVWLVFVAAIVWNIVDDDVDWTWVWPGDSEVAPAPPVSTDAPAEVLPPPSTEQGPEQPADTATATPPRADFRGLFTAEDYPSSALRNGDEGIVRARLLIGTDGQVRECTVMRSSGHASLDNRTCEIFLDSARFEPALDEAGNPVEAEYLTPAVNWQIPE